MFVFYVVYFIALSSKYLLDERGIYDFDTGIIILKQRILIILFTVTGFLILSYQPTQVSFDHDYLILGIGSLVFYIFGFIITSKVYKNGCRLLWNSIFFLYSISVVMLTRLNINLAQRQLLWCFFSIVISSFIPLAFKIINDFPKLKLFYLVSGMILLLSTFLFGSKTFGAMNWIKIGNMSFQPSEIVKILFVFYLASVFKDNLTIKQLITPIIFAALFVLILVMQRDLGGALIFFITFMMILYTSTGSIPLVIAGFSAAAVGSVLAYNIFAHIRVRIAAFINPWNDFYDKGYQILHSLFAIYTWGLFGSGLTRGIPKSIPVVESDFMFAALGEEFGIIFLICIILLYTHMYYRGVQVSLRAKNKFFTLVGVGITTMLVFQTFLIIGGNIKFIPLTGVTLPFVSYGGTSILTCTIMVGILQQIYQMNELGLIGEDTAVVEDIIEDVKVSLDVEELEKSPKLSKKEEDELDQILKNITKHSSETVAMQINKKDKD